PRRAPRVDAGARLRSAPPHRLRPSRSLRSRARPLLPDRVLRAWHRRRPRSRPDRAGPRADPRDRLCVPRAAAGSLRALPGRADERLRDPPFRPGARHGHPSRPGAQAVPARDPVVRVAIAPRVCLLVLLPGAWTLLPALAVALPRVVRGDARRNGCDQDPL